MAVPIIFPASPVLGDIYKVPSSGVNYQWDGYKWTTRTTIRSNSLGGNPSPTPPLNAVLGDFWFNTDDGQLYIYIDMGAGNLDWEKTSTINVKFMGDLP